MTDDLQERPGARLGLKDAASRAGCTSAYLAETIALGGLAIGEDGLVDADELAAWVERSWRPQQQALRAVVDAIDTMERRSLKPGTEPARPAAAEIDVDVDGADAEVGADGAAAPRPLT